MKTVAGSFLSMFIFLSFSLVALSQKSDLREIPMTTKSQEALKLYQDGIKALNDVKINESINYFNKASVADTNFIWPNIELALFNFYQKNMDQFKLFAKKALISTYSLNESEVLLQTALKKLLEDPAANVSEYAEKLVKLNPKSYTAYQYLGFFQQLASDFEGLDKTYHAELELTKNPGPIYNGMGYNYMTLNNMNKAKEAFENYIKAEPKNPNSYDSMGDYFAKVEDYKNAHSNFMKAYQMDTANFKFSLKKAKEIAAKLDK